MSSFLGWMDQQHHLQTTTGIFLVACALPHLVALNSNHLKKNTLFKSADGECVPNTPESHIDNYSVMVIISDCRLTAPISLRCNSRKSWSKTLWSSLNWWLDGSHSLTGLSGWRFELIKRCKPDNVCCILYILLRYLFQFLTKNT